MFCTKCGNQIKDGFKFCPKCGTPVYVEKEASQSEMKAQAVEVKEESSKLETDIKNDVKTKGIETNKSKDASSSNKAIDTSSTSKNYFSNPLIEKELDIEGIKKEAEQGNKVALLRQAFRYEMGIGSEKNVEKAKELFSQVGGKHVLFDLENSHMNCVLPDRLYDSAFSPTYENKEKNSQNLKVLP